MSERDFEKALDSQESVTDSLIEKHIGSLDAEGEDLEIGLSVDEVVEELSETLPKHLKSIGLIKADSISTEDLELLVAEGYTDIDDIENLYLLTWGEAITKLGPFARAKLNFMIEQAEKVDAAQLEAEWYEHASLQFEDLAIDTGYDNPNSQQKRNILRFSWLLENEPKLSKLVVKLRDNRSRGNKCTMYMAADDATQILNEATGELYNLPIEDLSSIDLLERDATLIRLQYTARLAQLVQRGLEPAGEN